MFPVADDFAAIAQRLKEIEAEVAEERAAAETRRHADDRRQLETQCLCGDTGACA